MTAVVEVAFEETTAFTLDESLLDTDELGPFDPIPTWTDVSADVRRAAVRRGRDRASEQPGAGSLVLELADTARVYDPENTAGAHYGQLRPRRQVRVTADGQPVFQGRSGPWTAAQPGGAAPVASVSAYDRLGELAPVAYTADWTLPAGSAADAAQAVLDEIGYTSSATLESTSEVADTALAAGTYALDTLRTLALGEGSSLYASATNELTMRDRYDQAGQPSEVTLTPDNTGVRYSSVVGEWARDTFAAVVVTSAAGSAVVTDAELLADYGPLTLAVSTLLVDEPQLEALAAVLEERHLTESSSLTVTVRLTAATPLADREALLALELGDLVVVVRAWSTGAPLTSAGWYVVGAIDHEIQAATHDLAYRLEPATGLLVFKLDTSLGALASPDGTVPPDGHPGSPVA